jgi:RNA polymerase sigma factor (sigma-70 family)
MIDTETVLNRALANLSSDRTDEDAWRDLYRIMWPFVFAICYRYLGASRNESEDAAQEAFIRLAKYSDFAVFSDSTALHMYMRRVARNVCNDHVSATPARSSYLIGRHLLGSAKNATANAEESVRINEIAQSLTASESELLHLLAGGSTINDARQRLGISYSAAAVRIHRLKQKLRKKFTGNVKTGEPRRFKG